ncbi:MAG: antitoxin [Gemmatimonadota bacterium]|nr:MAG: antitoxin [Gemmatimonadota bacterium]
MSVRIHIVIDEAEKERFRSRAELEGKTLAAWIREAAREKLAAGEGRRRLETREELRAFFASCDRRETGEEPDWEDHRRVIEGSKGSGSSDT